MSLMETSIDLAEIGIDSILDNPIVESIPFVKTVVGIAKTAQNIVERNLVKQTINFLNGYNSGEISEEKINAYRLKITTDHDKAEEELGRIIVILNKTVESEKSIILGRLFRGYIMGYINWADFCDLTYAIDSLFISDIPILLKTKGSGLEDPESDISYRIDRLAALGLVKTGTGTADDSVGELRFFTYATITAFGELFVKYGLEK